MGLGSCSTSRGTNVSSTPTAPTSTNGAAPTNREATTPSPGFIDWELTWTATNGEGGTLADASRGTSLDVHAAEIEAVICYRSVDCD